MKSLFIFDASIKLDQLSGLNPSSKIVDIFPLTDNIFLTHKVQHFLEITGIGEVKILKPADWIDNEFQEIRKKISKWSADLGVLRVGKKTLREWFLLPDNGISGWWFSTLSFKNPNTTDVFFKIAQAHAIKKLIEREGYEQLWLAIGDSVFNKTITNITSLSSVKTILLPTYYPQRKKEKYKSILKKIGILGEIIKGTFWLLRQAWRGYKSRSIMGKPVVKKKLSQGLLFVSYFPAIDSQKAAQGIFQNKFAGKLQSKLNEWKLPVTWLLMFISWDRWNFQDALKMGNQFAIKGEKIFFLDQFFAVSVLWRSILIWLRQICIFILVNMKLKSNSIVKGLTYNACKPLLLRDWHESFYGIFAIQGIAYYETFKNVFRNFKGITKSLYYCEMYPWEKALLSAAEKVSPYVETTGFLHGAYFLNDFFYFHHPRETIQRNNKDKLPLPDKLLTNGNLILDLMRECKYPNLYLVESPRHIYINSYLNKQVHSKIIKNVLLLAGVYNKKETIALLYYLIQAFPKTDNITIWIKGHPSQPIENIFKEICFDYEGANYKIVQKRNIDELLPYAIAIITGNSAVAIEALALGCEVIIPKFNNTPFMNPFIYCEECYHRVSSPEEMRNTVYRIKYGYRKGSLEQYRNFIKHYWCLDENFRRWQKVLCR